MGSSAEKLSTGILRNVQQAVQHADSRAVDAVARLVVGLAQHPPFPPASWTKLIVDLQVGCVWRAEDGSPAMPGQSGMPHDFESHCMTLLSLCPAPSGPSMHAWCIGQTFPQQCHSPALHASSIQHEKFLWLWQTTVHVVREYSAALNA